MPVIRIRNVRLWKVIININLSTNNAFKNYIKPENILLIVIVAFILQ